MWLATRCIHLGIATSAIESDNSFLLDPLLFQLARKRTPVHAKTAGSF